mmetsp:Transcript_50508/g.117915  ORF Transcript_50508/g.117915 Transcript_50508/m.117915 type:complete len:214 (-) Transcript_50508:62-703(-)
MGNVPQCAEACCVADQDKAIERPLVKKSEAIADGYSATGTLLAEDYVGTEHDPLAAQPTGADHGTETSPTFVKPGDEAPSQVVPDSSVDSLSVVQEEASQSREPLEKLPPSITIEEDKQSEGVEETFVLMVKKGSGAKLGMDLSHRGTHLGVRKIYQGYAVAMANEENAGKGGWTIREGDLIMSVNGVRGNDQELLKVCRNARDVEFGCRRPK